MNEATNFNSGYSKASNIPTTQVKNKIPYIPGGRDLDTNAIGFISFLLFLDAVYSNGYTEYDMHNLYAIN